MQFLNSMTVGGLALVLSAGVAGAGTVFVANLNGANERPTPVDTPAAGTVQAELDGSPGAWVLTYTITFADLTSPVIGGHIHQSILPPDIGDLDQTGPVRHHLDSLVSPITGDWRSDDPTNPLTDELVDALFDGELYVNIHTENFPDGEIRGQLVRDTSPTPIPLPAPLGLTLIGFATATPFMLKRIRKG
jgi:hypothetical protein